MNAQKLFEIVKLVAAGKWRLTADGRGVQTDAGGCTIEHLAAMAAPELRRVSAQARNPTPPHRD